MQSTIEIIDALKTHLSIDSDYGIAKKLGITRGAVSNYRAKRSFLDENTALRAAELLEISPSFVLAVAQSERAKCTKAREAWLKIAEHFSPTRQALAPYSTSEFEDTEDADCTLCKVIDPSYFL